MAEKFQILTFAFRGRTEVIEPANPNSINSDTFNSELQKQAVLYINDESGKFAQKIEREVERLLPPTITAQADVSCKDGSIVIEGTVILMSWLGSISLSAAKKEFEEQFSQIIKVAVRRAFSGLTVPPSNSRIAPVQVNFASATGSSANDSNEVDVGATVLKSSSQNANNSNAEQAIKQPSWLSRPSTPSILLLIFIGLIFLDRFFSIYSLQRQPTQVGTANSAPANVSPTSSPTPSRTQ